MPKAIKAQLVVLEVILVGVLQVGAAQGASSSPSLYHAWCGHWLANPVGASATVLGETQTPLPDGSVGQLVWGRSGNSIYIWARLANGAPGEHVALGWKDNQNEAIYQCGDSHGYSTATVWPGTTATWTAGVPLTPPTSKDATAECVGLLVWYSSGALEYQSPTCVTPWIGAPPPPAPSPTPPPEPPHKTHAPTAVKVLLHGSRGFLRNGQVLRLRGRVTGLGVGALVEMQAWVGKHHWMTFGVSPTHAGGRFSYRYRFTRTTGVHTYWLRARLPPQPRHHAHAAMSHAIRVRVAS